VSDISTGKWVWGLAVPFIPSGTVLGLLSYAGEHSLALLTIATLLAFAVSFIIALGTLGWNTAKGSDSSSLAGGDTAGRSPKALSDLTHDVWLADAVVYAVHGEWLSEAEKPHDDWFDPIEISPIIQEMRHRANRGEYLIWGRTAPGRLHEKMPEKFWIDNQIRILFLASVRSPERVETGSAIYLPSEIHYSALKANKWQTEQIWPTPTSP
jgi:hypothetical protein